MLFARFEMKLGAGLERFDRERLIGGASPNNDTAAFFHFDSLIFLFVLFEREIFAALNDKKFFDARMFVQSDDHSAPACFDDAIAATLNASGQFIELLRTFANPKSEHFTPRSTCCATITIEACARIDRREFAELVRNRTETWIGTEFFVIDLEARAHQCPPVVDTVTAPLALLNRGHMKP